MRALFISRLGMPTVLSLILTGSSAWGQGIIMDELLAGANGDSTIRFVELRFEQAGDQLWGPQGLETEGRARLVFFDARGEQISEYVFPDDPVVGVEDPERGGFSVLTATQAFADLDGVPVPDFIMPEGPLADSGKVCFAGNPDNPNAVNVRLCVSYGDNYVGDTEDTSGDPGPSMAITNAVTLQRVANFDAYSTTSSNADFASVSAAPRNSAGVEGIIELEPDVVQGESLFNRETFLGNGRTCFTCHRPEDQFGLSPATIASLPLVDPLFVAEFNPDLAELENSCLMRDGRALILENIDGFENDPVFRGSPHLLNLALTAPYGLSGEFANLRDFATGAVKQHFPRTLSRNADASTGPLDFRLPTEEELLMMEAFMQSIPMPADSNFDLDRMIESGIERGGDAAEIEAGRALFFGDAKCFNCHGGPVLAEADGSLGGGNRRFNTGVVNLPTNDTEFCLNGGPLPEEDGGEREFSVPPLIGISLTGPFFHDNAFDTLRDAVSFYGGDEFAGSPASALIGGIELNNTEIDQITAFLEALTEPNKVHNRTQVLGFNTIQEAIDAAADGDEIEVDPGTYFENVDFLDKDIVLRSRDPLDAGTVAETIIDGGGLDTVVDLSAGELSGFTITNGRQDAAQTSSAGVHAVGTAVVRNNIITGNVHDGVGGGGVGAFGDSLVVANRIVGNTAATRGGGVNARGNSVVVGNFISENSAIIAGGGVRCRDDAVIRNNTIVHNSSAGEGGGVFAEDATVVSNNIIAFHTDGAGLHADLGSVIDADFNCVSGNVEGDYAGEAVAGPNDLNTDPQLAADGLHLTSGSPCLDAGDPAVVPVAAETDIDGESRIVGAAIDIGADEVVPVRNLTQGTDHVTIQAAIDAALTGDVIEVRPGTYLEHIDLGTIDITVRSTDPLDPDVVASTIIDGESIDGSVVRLLDGEVSGFTIRNGLNTGLLTAGVHALGTGVVSHNVITGNVATGSGAGGISAFDDTLIRNNVIVGNSAVLRSGGVNCRGSSVVINNVIADNTSNTAAGGARVRDSARLRNNLIIGNSTAGSGGGVQAEGAGLVSNNIIAFSLDGGGLSVVAGSTVIADFNCVFGNVEDDYVDAALPGANDVNLDPLLDADGVHLTAVSPCIDAGDPGLIPLDDETDLDLSPRIDCVRVDIGPIEFADCNGNAGDDALDIRDGIDGDDDLDGVPNSCDLDCNANTIPDYCDVLSGVDSDCDDSGVLDECELNDLILTDGNGNGTPDECENLTVHNVTQGIDFQSIQEAIDQAVDGDVIEADPGTFFENIDLGTKNVLVRSLDPTDELIVAATIIDGGGLDTCVSLEAGEISGFTIRNGGLSGDQAAGVRALGNGRVTFNVITGNVAPGGGPGGVSSGDNAVVRYNRIIGNTALSRGGGVAARSSSEVTNNLIVGNLAVIEGGGARVRENAVFRHNTVLSNSSLGTAGGILVEDDAVVRDNIVAFTTQGAGIEAIGTSTDLNHNCVFDNAGGDYANDEAIGPDDINVDPLLEDDDLHLSSLSPCINAGDPGFVPAVDESDIDGGLRVADSVTDIGADEFSDCNDNGVDDFFDVRDGTSSDCNASRLPDECDLTADFFSASPQFSPLGAGFPQSHVLVSPPDALSDVVLTFSAIGDLNIASEFVAVDINGLSIGSVFVIGGSQCPLIPDVEFLIVPAATYNSVIEDGELVITMTPSAVVDADACLDEFIDVTVDYFADNDCGVNGVPDECAPDCNLNGRPDECDISTGGSDDDDGDGLPDECDDDVPLPCEGDANGDGQVDPLDTGFVQARFGCPVGSGDVDCDAADSNGDLTVDPLDVGFVQARFGVCP